MLSKGESAPKYSQKIGNHHVLWFENSNSYIVLSSPSYLYLQLYLSSQDKEAFMQAVSDVQGPLPDDIASYYEELSLFLAEVNVKDESQILTPDAVSIPKPSIIKNYSFGETLVTINYASETILKLIHPQFEHYAIPENGHGSVFDIFGSDDLLYLFKNQSPIGAFKSGNFHLLQGKFAMELVTTLYNNSEKDWLATFHASTVCNEHEAVMLIGDSGNGKSTLSALLMAAGYDLLADDFTPMYGQNQHLYRFPSAISIKKGAFDVVAPLYEEFGSLQPQINSSKQLTVKYVPPSRPFKYSKKNFECHKIVLVKYSPGAESQLKECPAEKLLQILIPDAWISPLPHHSQQFLTWLANTKFYELTYSDNGIAVAKFKELLKV